MASAAEVPAAAGHAHKGSKSTSTTDTASTTETAGTTDTASTADTASTTDTASTADTAKASTSATVTSDEVNRYAKAALQVRAIDADASLTAEQKKASMTTAVEAQSLTSQRFNEISDMTKKDPELLKQVQAAMAKVPASETQAR